MGKREFQIILGLVVETCNVYTIIVRVIYHNLILKTSYSGTNHSSVLWEGDRNILGLVVGTCNIYTVLARNYSTTP